MLTPSIFEWPHPQINQDWDSGYQQWREITPLAYQELQAAGPLQKTQADAFMQTELVDILPDGDGLYVCCKRENGSCFARLLPSTDWWKRDYLPVPVVGSMPDTLFFS